MSQIRIHQYCPLPNLICPNMKIFVKNMLSYRCQLMVEAILKRLDIDFNAVALGVVDLKESLSEEKSRAFDGELRKIGLELFCEKSLLLVEKVKALAVKRFYLEEELPKVAYSVFFSTQFKMSYAQISKRFYQATGSCIEQYIIRLRIEKAKELLRFQQLSLTEVAHRLHYSSVAHLSKQFKDITGFCVTQYRAHDRPEKKYLDQLAYS